MYNDEELTALIIIVCVVSGFPSRLQHFEDRNYAFPLSLIEYLKHSKHLINIC